MIIYGAIVADHPNMLRMEADSETRGNALAGAFSLLAAIFTAAFYVFLTVLPSPSSTSVLSSFITNGNPYTELFITSVFFGAFGILFIGGLGRLLAPKSPKVASGATLLAAIGVLLVALAPIVFVGALSSITSSPSGPTYQAIATYQAAFWYSEYYIFLIVGVLFISAGLILFGWLNWRTGILPNWLTYVAVVGGVAEFVSIPLSGFVSFILSIVNVAAVIIWGLVVGVILLRRQHSTPSVASTS